ncbi:MAG: S1 family peptidase [Acidimicrobiia bacterium]|nr:S1 family peptidase [Acidimicrobiia bacterium]
MLALVAMLAAALVSPSSAQVAKHQSGETESGSIDVVSFLAKRGVKLPPAVAGQFAALSEADQQQRLLSLGVDRSILHGDITDRPMPLVAELLRVLDPDAPRPEVASDADYARSMVEVGAGSVIADLQGDYSSRLGFARWDNTSDGDRVLVIPVVGASKQEVGQIEAMALPGNTPIRVESIDISYQDLRELKDAVDASIRATTGDRLGDWSIGIDSEPQKVFVRVDLSRERNKKILAGLNNGIDSETTTVVDEQTTNGQGSQQIGNLLVGGDQTTATVDDGLTGNKQTGNLLAGLTVIVHDVANSFVVAEIPSSNRTGAELVMFADGKMEPPDDFRETSNIRGGEWVVSDNGGGCTTNFLWKKGNAYRMGTAGHCSTTTGTYKGHRAYRSFDHRTLAGVNNGDIGTVTHNGWTDGSYSDYALMTMPAAATTTSRVMTTSGNWRTVIAVSALSNLKSNTYVFCHVGLGLKQTHRLDKSCGTITERDITHTYDLSTGDKLTLRGLYCTNAKHAGGDSGGPHYLEIGDDAYAVGIHHGSYQGDACFTTVQAAKARHQHSIVLN